MKCVHLMSIPFSYVLLHHVMGNMTGTRGAWAYVQGGMGALSDSIAASAMEHGASVFTNSEVQQIMVDDCGCAVGVALTSGEEIKSKIVLSNATAHVTYLQLTPQSVLPRDFIRAVSQIDYSSAVTKINVAVEKLPSFKVFPNSAENEAEFHHGCTIHLNAWDMECLDLAFRDAYQGIPSKRPLIEMCIPSVLDSTLAPPGKHVVLLFTQYTPYLLAGGRAWEQVDRDTYADRVFDCIEEYAPGFKDSVISRDILVPVDLERIFGLTGGNIFHGAMSLDQLFTCRPLHSHCGAVSPIRGLFLCGSGAHPGGGVMGSAGRLAALTALASFRD